MGKRIFDVFLALFLLVLLAPIMAVIALAIMLDDGHPVLFAQTRIGRYGKPFRILKFRSMRNRADGASLTIGNDPRITRVGAFIRRFRLDELPQLFNVLRGDMSFVGPRPEVPKYVACYPSAARRRIQELRPGITDTASIRFRDEDQILAAASDPERVYVENILPEKIACFLDYVDNRSFLGDLTILWQTFVTVFIGRHSG